MRWWSARTVTELLDAARIEAALDWQVLIDELHRWYVEGAVQAPERQVLRMPQPDGSEASLLIMPAWVPGSAIGVKVVTFLPENAQAGRPTINAGYLLFDGETGQMKSAMEADVLTERRTAAASALAASRLARPDARRLVIAGTGQLSRAMARAHSVVQDYDTIWIWGRNADSAEHVARDLQADGLPASAVTDLQAACETADVISTVTASTKPLIRGRWLRPGTHLDLVGAFREDMRESDDRAISQARIFVDTRDGAMRSGDLFQPAEVGLFDPTHIEADLAELCRRDHPGRENAEDFTVFKSVGQALTDLAAAQLATARSHPETAATPLA
ncbi:ornithine cyclodeaminase family protein [Mameliella alba]|nr:ornithine cyclodeaminase family protein [Antarctobacter heliothermus]MBY6146575.1 ornithine cyclodeaminase family protein [Mameliella alba]